MDFVEVVSPGLFPEGERPDSSRSEPNRPGKTQDERLRARPDSCEIPQLSSELRDLGKWPLIRLRPEEAEAVKMADDPIVDIDPSAFSEDEE